MHVVYASHGYTTHDRRFLQAIALIATDVTFVRFDGHTRTLEERGLPSGVRLASWLGNEQQMSSVPERQAVEATRQILRDVDPDVVHAGPLPGPAYLTVACGVAPVVAMSWASDLLVDATHSPVARQRAAKALSGAAQIIVDCQYVARLAETFGAEAERVTILPWGVDLDRHEPQPREHHRRLRLVSMRELEPLYDVATLIRGVAHAAAGGVDLELTIAGAGSAEAALRHLARALAVDDRITWVGRVPEPTIASLLSTHDIYVSTSPVDGSSISLLQAMAVARPAIVTDIASNREWVTPEIGWLFDAGDAVSLGEAILLAASTSNHRLDEMGAAALKVVRDRADWSRNKGVLKEVYAVAMSPRIEGDRWR